MYINKNGSASRGLSSSIIQWEHIAERVVLSAPYIVLFSPNFLEIRNVATGRVAQIIPGTNIRALWDSRTGSLKSSSTSGQNPAPKTRILGSMNTSSVDAAGEQIFELLPVTTAWPAPDIEASFCCHLAIERY